MLSKLQDCNQSLTLTLSGANPGEQPADQMHILELIEVNNGEHDDNIMLDLMFDEECDIVQFNTVTILMQALANPAQFHQLNLQVSVNPPQHEIIVRKASVLFQTAAMSGKPCANLTIRSQSRSV